MMLKLIPPRQGHSPYWSVRGTYLGRKIDKSTKARTRGLAELVLRHMQEKIAAGDGLTWKQIPGFSRYEISDNGLIKRLPAILKQTRKPSGHLQVTVYNDKGKQWSVGAHHLVARAFLGDPPEGKPYACHIDGDPANNRPGNLYWGSAADNAADAVRHSSLVRSAVESVSSRRARYRRTKRPMPEQALIGAIP